MLRHSRRPVDDPDFPTSCNKVSGQLLLTKSIGRLRLERGTPDNDRVANRPIARSPVPPPPIAGPNHGTQLPDGQIRGERVDGVLIGTRLPVVGIEGMAVNDARQGWTTQPRRTQSRPSTPGGPSGRHIISAEWLHYLKTLTDCNRYLLTRVSDATYRLETPPEETRAECGDVDTWGTRSIVRQYTHVTADDDRIRRGRKARRRPHPTYRRPWVLVFGSKTSRNSCYSSAY